MRTIPLFAVLAAAILLTGWTNRVAAASGGSAEVRVETTPPAGAGSLRFDGLPAGEVSLSQDGTASLSADVADGQHVSTLAWIDPALVDAGYRLAAVECNDVASERRSHGNVSQGTATFEVEADESVACTFQLAIASACTCPEEGRWSVNNHRGSMVCTGVMPMTMPLRADRGQGTLTVNDDCSRILAEGMSDDEADLDMALQSDCSWKGAVGGEQDGIPMTINFHWNVENERRITGDLESTVTQQGMTCRMSRTYELDYDG